MAPHILNGANHALGPESLAKHGLDGVLKAFGGDKVAAFYALERGAQQLASQGEPRDAFLILPLVTSTPSRKLTVFC
jgi:hypothetical protein